MTWAFAPLMPNRYGVILADPSWQYSNYSEAGYAKSPEAHYDTMPLDAIAELPVWKLAGPNCLLVMWSTWPHLSFAMEIMRVWGFEYKTGGSWFKRSKSGGSTFGTGHIVRSSCEPYIVGTIGRPRIVSKSVRNVIETDELETFPSAIDALRREHSRKPDEMRAMLERLCPWARCVDLFSRQPWPGHDVWGRETNRFAAPEGSAA